MSGKLTIVDNGSDAMRFLTLKRVYDTKLLASAILYRAGLIVSRMNSVSRSTY